MHLPYRKENIISKFRPHPSQVLVRISSQSISKEAASAIIMESARWVKTVIIASMTASSEAERESAATAFASLQLARIAFPVLTIVQVSREGSLRSGSVVVMARGKIRPIAPTRAAPVESLNVAGHHSHTAVVTTSAKAQKTAIIARWIVAHRLSAAMEHAT
jgi:hypothetical protein